MQEAETHGAEVLLIDSEHNAGISVYAIQLQERLEQVGKFGVFLAASGGPFRTASLKALEEVTPDQTCVIPTGIWDARFRRFYDHDE